MSPKSIWLDVFHKLPEVAWDAVSQYLPPARPKFPPFPKNALPADSRDRAVGTEEQAHSSAQIGGYQYRQVPCPQSQFEDLPMDVENGALEVLVDATSDDEASEVQTDVISASDSTDSFVVVDAEDTRVEIIGNTVEADVDLEAALRAAMSTSIARQWSPSVKIARPLLPLVKGHLHIHFNNMDGVESGHNYGACEEEANERSEGLSVGTRGFASGD